MKKTLTVSFMIVLTIMYIFVFGELISSPIEMSTFSFTVIFLSLLAIILTIVIFSFIIYHDLFD